MLKSKQKAYLKSLANRLNPIYQIGKDGISEELIQGLLNYLKVHELMKVSVLNNSMVTMEEIEDALYEADIELVAKIGHIFILYKASEDAKNPIILP